jgi:hypothetical protein
MEDFNDLIKDEKISLEEVKAFADGSITGLLMDF